ncbi:hypothetical protein [Ectothiorhodospira lacustris]|uniref:hypothetical protein n=1 Tax=Ectothiorhodospira lacustris TaxID=2899127 RepID=UPI001EE855A0|nr:hypothetical protein [Ectothiorhodospira lacustris]MCG5500481.1 hypothetical protein [Ectothiorhodospira lacustris]
MSRTREQELTSVLDELSVIVSQVQALTWAMVTVMDGGESNPCYDLAVIAHDRAEDARRLTGEVRGGHD